MILLDLDRFKVINESVGHAVGDRLLVAVGQRLAACLRPGDTVARFGGDEFGIILDPVADADEARRIADRIAAELRAPFPLGGREWFISASMGIALGRAGPRHAGRAAARGRDRDGPGQGRPVRPPRAVRAVDERPDARAHRPRERPATGARARRAARPLPADRRPARPTAIVGLRGARALAAPRRAGSSRRSSFIPLAEETGLIVPLGRWVLETACRQAAAWRDAPAGGAPLVMSVNLSARQFAQPDLVDEIAAILAETGLEPAALELEITESVVMDQSETGVRALRRLRELGVRLVLDDFGTGYSSLSYLKHLPLDTIKIDRSFVAGLDERRRPLDRRGGHRARPRPAASASSPRASRPRPSAAGCIELGCDLGQGYLFSRPVPAEPTPAPRCCEPRRRRGVEPRVGARPRAADAGGRWSVPAAEEAEEEQEEVDEVQVEAGARR